MKYVHMEEVGMSRWTCQVQDSLLLTKNISKSCTHVDKGAETLYLLSFALRLL